MNTKYFLNVVVAIVAAVGLSCCGSGGSSKGTKGGKGGEWPDNKIVTQYQGVEVVKAEKPEKARIYIDASGSMKPYFKSDDASMVNTVSELLNIDPDNTEIFFLDSPRAFKGLVKNIVADVNKQPNESSTAFHQFFKNAVKEADHDDAVVYLVTDGIMSVGRNTNMALAQLRGQIASALQAKPDGEDDDHDGMAAAIFRYTGGYNGDYWDQNNSKTGPYTQQRPYYVIAVGEDENIQWLKEQKPAKLNNPQAALYFGLRDFEHLAAGADLASPDKVKSVKLNKPVSVVVELPAGLEDVTPEFVADNGTVTNRGNRLSPKVRKEANRLMFEIPPTEALQTEGDGSVKIEMTLPNVTPVQWAGEFNTDDDTAGPDETTTFGLRHLVDGMRQGLEPDRDTLLKTTIVYRRK